MAAKRKTLYTRLVVGIARANNKCRRPLDIRDRFIIYAAVRRALELQRKADNRQLYG